MSRFRPVQANIPTNIITGFLGAGKTSAIRRWLADKPASETWAVLVNEFGQVGIDGALLANDGIAVKEVPGGCMCCVTGLPSKVALNQLIREQQPDRLLIEPTGLAHPQQVIRQFSGAEYQTLLDLQAVVCLLDPATLADERYQRQPAFYQQAQLADILVASKTDLASPEQRLAFEQFCQPLVEQLPTRQLCYGPLPWERLTLAHQARSHVHSHPSHALLNQSPRQTAPLNPIEPEPSLHDMVRYENQSPYGFSCGWRIPARWQFDKAAFLAWLDALCVARVKGVVHFESGWSLINITPNSRSIEAIASAPIGRSDSRLEIIHTEAMEWQPIENALSACITKIFQ